MIEQLEEEISGVICLHCRMHTAVAKSTQQSLSGKTYAELRPQIRIVRCSKCGGEAPYLTNELIAMKRIPAAGARAF
jgi:hypothetical protein